MLPSYDALPKQVAFSDEERALFKKWLEKMKSVAEEKGSSLGDVVVELVFNNVGGMMIQARAASLLVSENNPIVLRPDLDW